jgi:VanZ family protein
MFASASQPTRTFSLADDLLDFAFVGSTVSLRFALVLDQM